LKGALNTIPYHGSTGCGIEDIICDTRAQNPSFVILGFLFNHISHYLLQKTFYRIKISCY